MIDKILWECLRMLIRVNENAVVMGTDFEVL